MFKFAKSIIVSCMAIALTLTGQAAMAVSQFPTAQAALFATDIGDTAAELRTWLIGIAFVVGLAFFAVNMTKKGLGKVGGS